MGYKNVHKSIVKIEDLNDLDLKKYTRRCLKDMELSVKNGPLVENILLKNGKTSYRVEITLEVFAYKAVD